MWNYDSWLLEQAEKYMSPCEPELDRDGDYRCVNCDSRFECEAWKEINGDEE